jgi:hypothetical protein
MVRFIVGRSLLGESVGAAVDGQKMSLTAFKLK